MGKLGLSIDLFSPYYVRHRQKKAKKLVFQFGSLPATSEKRHGRVEIHYLKNCGSEEKHSSGRNSCTALNL
jgi:hypothetical protein